MKTGEVIRYLRVSKNIKANTLYFNILSRPAILKFEKGISDTTTEKLFMILDRLNITLEEFFFIYNTDKANEDNKFFKTYFESFTSADINRLMNLREDRFEAYNNEKNAKNLHYTALADLTISYLSKETLRTDSFNILKEYLIKCEEWHYYELVLFTNTLDFFSEELIILLYKRAKQKMIFYKQMRKYGNEVFSLILNILVFFIERNNIEKTELFFNELIENRSKTNNMLYENAMIIFIEELITLMKTKVETRTKIDEIIMIFQTLDMPVKAKQCRGLYEVVQKNNLTNSL